MPALQLSLRDVSKSFGGVKALRGVSLDVPKGIVLGLVGENGAGKSTLMNIIGGVHRPDTGDILVAGEPYRPQSPRDAARGKIGFIHQELNLFTNLSIAENMFIDGMPRRLGVFTDKARMQREARALLDRLQLSVDPDSPVESLSPGERQIVEIAKALHRNSELIIFDEPTTSLTARETERLFKVIADLRASGCTVIYISHILRDVMALSDRIAVLRDGALVDEAAVDSFDIGRMIRLMIGRDLQGLFPPKTARETGPAILEIEGLTQPGVLRDVSLSVRAGEIVGLFGLLGAGRSELARIVFGLDAFAGGSIRLNGVELGGRARGRVRRAIDAGLAFVTENRREEGLLMEASVADNLSLVSLRQLARLGGLVDGAAVEGVVRTASSSMRIKAADFDRQPVRSLSGGNQQKVVIGKWLINRPRLFILDEPTRGVDVGSKYEIYAIAQDLAAAGSGVLFISSEMEELVGTCDRILVMARGELRGAFDSEPFSTERMLRAAFAEEAERAA